MSDIHPLHLFVPLDLCERHGGDAERLIEGLSFDRVTLSRGQRVPWTEYVRVLERLDEMIGRDRIIECALQTHEALDELAALGGLVMEPVALYHLILRLAVRWSMPPVRYRLIDLGGRRVRIEARLRPRYADGLIVFEVANLGFATTPAHLGLPIANIVSHDAGPRRSDTVLELPVSKSVVRRLRERNVAEAWDTARAFARTLLEDRVGAREVVRDSVVATLRDDLTAERELHGVANLLVERLASTLELDGLRLAVGSSLQPMRERGVCEGIRIRRTLRFGGAPVGEIEAYVTPERVSRVAMALDAILPWTSTAVGMALDAHAAYVATRSAQRDEAEALALDRAACALGERAMFEMQGDATVVAHGPRAEALLARDRDATLALIARIATARHLGEYSAVELREAGAPLRLLILERSPPFSTEAFARAIGASERERSVLGAFLQGRSNKEIAAALGVTETTIEGHLTSLYAKAGVKNRFALAAAVLVGLE